MDFNVALKTILLKGTLAWEYNPFRNYRLDLDMVYYKNRYYKADEFDWSNTDETPIVCQKGQLVDFVTKDFDFDLNHPVQITPAYSYDNSVDLIINDGKTSPKIINSRFSAIGKNKYEIVDRVGSNDTNIYDKGNEQFKIDTSLYKITTKIPEIEFGGESYGGNLKIGNYHFYFKYSDSDGNESDYVALSGLVSIFRGNTPNSINSGFRDQNSNKRVRFILSNIDKSYDYIIVYYTRATSEEFLNSTTEYFKIDLKFKVSQSKYTTIDITGFENIIPSTFEEINERLQIYDSAKSQAISQNMLFLANTTQSNENHDDLTRLALYIYPTLDTSVKCEVNELSDSYQGDISNTYYNPNFIYNYTGYWEDEIYRFGVVFIRTNNTLTPVYNIRGIHLENNIDKIPYNKENKVTYDETTFKIDKDFICSSNHAELENAKGVCYIPFLDNIQSVIGINFKCNSEVIEALKKLEIKGFFIVRQKRIPTTLCLAYVIGLEQESHLPMINTLGEESMVDYKYESFINEEESKYVYWNEDGKKKYKWGNLLSHLYEKHLRTALSSSIMSAAAICPDYDVNTPYLNTLFSGGTFVAINRYADIANLKQSNTNPRLHVLSSNPSLLKESFVKYLDVKIIGVEDDVKLVGIDNLLFSARGGEAEEAFRYAHVGLEIKEKHGGTNLVRGSFGPYLGISGYNLSGDLITIKIPGYRTANMEDYFNIRYTDCSPFYPISNRLLFKNNDNEVYNLGTFYRGDCYICKFTHRLNRNFRSPSTPTNDTIIDSKTWTHNINFEDEVLKKEDLDKINLGDVNAVNLGQWITITVRSNINHSVRSINESMPDETVLTGNVRGFFPYHPLSAQSAYKLPESGTYNKGFEASVGELVFYELPNVPYYKDIFSTRIAYSNLLITSAFKNAYRVFQSTHFRDYPITYGEITKIIEWDGDIICVLEHGIYRIPINERAVAGQGSGGTVFINTNNVLPENPLVISDTFGSLWIDSIIKTPTGIYGVDTVAKKIWKVDNTGIETISDFKVQEFLNNNISLTERELTPIIGLRNVKTHYNAFKHDVMFTFYDDIHGLDEVAWNLCWNELQNKWISFYSWMPSFSENIDNLYFSFDRNTSRDISKISLNEYSLLNDYIYLDNAIMDSNPIGHLHYDLVVEGATVNYKWEILKDANNNHTRFRLDDPNSNTPTLHYTDAYSSYVIPHEDIVKYDGNTYTYESGNWKQILERPGDPVNPIIYVPITDRTMIAVLDREREATWRRLLENPPKGKSRVYTLNIRVTPTVTYNGTNATFDEYVSTKNVNAQLTGGYIDRTVAVIPEEHLEGLSSDFWKHGQAGLIDITEDILPTNWYGKQHPFEFEFIVRDSPDVHKIFDNLVIISNKAEPESFHYEVIGECYEFAKDKKNMYIRQEATKELFQNNGENISYNDNYKELLENHRILNNTKGTYEKSTILPAYYERKDLLNTIEDYYHQRDNENGKDFSLWSGSEVVYYKKLNEYRIWTHSKGVNLKDHGLLRGNMIYKEDRWDVLIPSINLVLCNEPDWRYSDFGASGSSNKIPVELKHANFVNASELDISSLKNRGVVQWKDDKVKFSEAKLKDKYIKIRVRYSGKDLAVISAIKTLFSISYA